MTPLNYSSLTNNSTILQEQPFVNLPNQHNPRLFGNIPSSPTGCVGLSNNSQIGGYRFRRNKIHHSKQNISKQIKSSRKYLKSLRKHSKKGGKTKHKRYRKKFTHKKRHSKHHKYSKHKNKKYRGGGNHLLKFSSIDDTTSLNTSQALNNVPYSQGYNIDLNSNSEYGALANPIPYTSYAKCPPKLNFN